MDELSEEQKRRIMETPPRGTWAILLIFGVLFLAAWLLMYFGVFMPRGPVT